MLLFVVNCLICSKLLIFASCSPGRQWSSQVAYCGYISLKLSMSVCSLQKLLGGTVDVRHVIHEWWVGNSTSSALPQPLPEELSLVCAFRSLHALHKCTQAHVPCLCAHVHTGVVLEHKAGTRQPIRPRFPTPSAVSPYPVTVICDNYSPKWVCWAACVFLLERGKATGRASRFSASLDP